VRFVVEDRNEQLRVAVSGGLKRWLWGGWWRGRVEGGAYILLFEWGEWWILRCGRLDFKTRANKEYSKAEPYDLKSRSIGSAAACRY
jgi:hypothetical protein